ncbi:hypothetical protein [Heterosigma akashiwo virus 01]|uniref:Uncharacterized protein n=1 Tax=Heterosigma akashiwo virus 01 TaxID=97195 RepID=A0A1C9C598_HAV01|nr:hypothetical protein D1R72_gp126 [Heterosigma akashiwo virus 01]AOM63457.1 hypothetical protein [Heterosigma akashiwo virus 01]
MEFLDNNELITYMHHLINSKRNIKTQRTIFALPIAIPLEREMVENNIRRFEYSIMKISNVYDNTRVMVTCFKYNNENYTVLFNKKGMYYDYSNKIKFSDDVYNATILDCDLIVNEDKLLIRDILCYKGEPCFNVYAGFRKEYMFQLLGDIDKEKTCISLEMYKVYDYNEFKENLKESGEEMPLLDFDKLLFIPKTIPIGINIQRTMFFWEHTPGMFLKMNVNDTTITLSACSNTSEKDNVVIATIKRDCDRGQQILDTVDVKTIDGKVCYMNYDNENETFKVCKVIDDDTIKADTLRIIEQVFCMNKENIKLEDIFF